MLRRSGIDNIPLILLDVSLLDWNYGHAYQVPTRLSKNTQRMEFLSHHVEMWHASAYDSLRGSQMLNVSCNI